MDQSENGPKSILVIDDDPDIVDFLHDLLEMEGYAVTTTTKAEYVEKFPKKNFPDLILLDVFLSGRDGREIVTTLKKQEDTRHIPVIMFSAHPQAEATARGAGADDFVAKPFDLDILLAKMRTFLL